MSRDAKKPNASLRFRIGEDILRHPVSSKVRKMLHRALEMMKRRQARSGDRDMLQETLAKYPDSSGLRAQFFMGEEHRKTERFHDAARSLRTGRIAAAANDAMTHYNFGSVARLVREISSGPNRKRAAPSK